VIIEGGDEFGATQAPVTAAIIPFPNMRANRRVAEAWEAEVRARNAKLETRHKFPSPLGVLDELIRKRTAPALPWPAGWPELAKRARMHAGDCVGVVGASGGGKTSFALQVCRSVMGDSIPVLWCALELDETQIATRLVANMHGVHSIVVREQWSRERIAHSLAAVDDLWRFVDRYVDIDQQLRALADAIALAKRIYRVAPLVVIDYLGKMASLARDMQLATVQAAEHLRALAVEHECYVMMLSQGSRANSVILTGRLDLDAATDAIGMAAHSAEVENACRVMLNLVVFKADDVPVLDAHVLVTKSNTGMEGRQGFQFSKPGGVWTELGYLPATPGEIKATVIKAKADKHRTAPAPTAPEAARDLNLAKAGDADAARRVALTAAITRHGQIGMARDQMRLVMGAGRAALITGALRELVKQGLIESCGDDRWRLITGRIV